MSAPQSFESWWLGVHVTRDDDARSIARKAWMAGQCASLALAGARTVYVLDYIGSDDIPRRMVYATRAAADRALARSNKRAMITVETVRTF